MAQTNTQMLTLIYTHTLALTHTHTHTQTHTQQPCELTFIYNNNKVHLKRTQ